MELKERIGVSRRRFLQAQAVTVAAVGLSTAGLRRGGRVMAAESGVPVVWVQGQACTGCSVSLLNSAYYMPVEELLTQHLDVEFHPNLMAASGAAAVDAANEAFGAGGYVLVVEGAIPTGANGAYCHLWPGTTAEEGVTAFAQNAAFVLAVGTCAAFGGISAGSPNPTGALGVGDLLGWPSKLANIPGCPPHPDWVVGTVAYILTYGRLPELDDQRRPKEYFREEVHEECFLEDEDDHRASELGQTACLVNLGCKGKRTKCDCPTREWHSPAGGQKGVSWCIEAGSPCHGCTEPGFPDAMSPFFTLGPNAGRDGGEDDEEDDNDRRREEDRNGSTGDAERDARRRLEEAKLEAKLADYEKKIADKWAKSEQKIAMKWAKSEAKMAVSSPEQAARIRAETVAWEAKTRAKMVAWEAKTRAKIAQYKAKMRQKIAEI